MKMQRECPLEKNKALKSGQQKTPASQGSGVFFSQPDSYQYPQLIPPNGQRLVFSLESGQGVQEGSSAGGEYLGVFSDQFVGVIYYARQPEGRHV